MASSRVTSWVPSRRRTLMLSVLSKQRGHARPVSGSDPAVKRGLPGQGLVLENAPTCALQSKTSGKSLFLPQG